MKLFQENKDKYKELPPTGYCDVESCWDGFESIHQSICKFDFPSVFVHFIVIDSVLCVFSFVSGIWTHVGHNTIGEKGTSELLSDKSLRRGGHFSQAERNFGLSVLSLCGRLPDIDREGECSQENNATFDKLMRDFKGTSIPFAMELFL